MSLNKPKLKKPVKIKRNDIETRFKVGHLGYRGKKNGIWKGDNAGYNAIHIWLRTNFGKPNKCKNKLCIYPRTNKGGKKLEKPKMFQWALLKGKRYSHNRKNFIMLCVSCHKKYDDNIKKIKI